MKKQKLFILPILVLSTIFVFTACDTGTVTKGDLDSNIDSVSYAFGYLTGVQMEDRGMTTLKPELIVAGIQHAFKSDSALIDRQKMIAIMRDYQVEARARMMRQRMAKAERNKEKAQEFLAQNKKKEGVKVTESGLQYKVLKEGTGESPTIGDTVKVHYKGMLLSGKVFDSSYKRGQPATFPLNRVIQGWTEGLQLMKEGAVYKFWIPGRLAYGTTPPPNSPIGPNELLIFKVELLKVK